MINLNFKKIFILNIFLILFSTLFLNIYLDKERFLIKYPDDNFHYLTKSTILKDCKNLQKNSCLGVKRLNDLNKKDFENHIRIDLERQKQRLTISYHPLYTFLLNNFFSNFETFNAHKISKYILGAISGFIILYYINIFIPNQKIVFLIILIYGAHFFYRGVQGIHFIDYSAISAFLSALSVIFLFYKRKYLFYVFILLSVTMHHVGLLFTISNYLAFKIYQFSKKKNYKILVNKQNIIEYISIIIFLIISYNLKYNFFPQAESSFNIYELNFKNFDIFKIVVNNFSTLLIAFFPTVILLNPITLYFFTKLFISKGKDKDIISLLKMMFLISLIFIIFVPIGSSDSTVSFAYGNRSWEIFILNFLILSFHFISKIKDKKDEILKKLFYYSIPIFVCVNILLIIDRANFIKSYDDFYHDNKNFSEFLLNKTDKDKILIDLHETNFYYLLNNGLITKNFYIKNFISSEESQNYDYSIIQNPLQLTPRSGIVINNMDKISTNTTDVNLNVIFYSIKDQNISINNKFYQINKGLNIISLLNQDFIFNNLKKSIYLLGIKINDKQKSNWPWYSDFKFTIYTKIYTWNLFLDKKIDIKKEYDFTLISKNLNPSLNFDCENELISDVDSTLIFSLNCN